MNLLLKTHWGGGGDRRPDFIFCFLYSNVQWVDGWRGGCSGKFYRGSAEISSYCVSSKIQGWGCRVGLVCHNFATDINQGHADFGVQESRWVQDLLVWPQGWKGSP